MSSALTNQTFASTDGQPSGSLPMSPCVGSSPEGELKLHRGRVYCPTMSRVIEYTMGSCKAPSSSLPGPLRPSRETRVPSILITLMPPLQSTTLTRPEPCSFPSGGLNIHTTASPSTANGEESHMQLQIVPTTCRSFT